jgi:hypothetical protein
VQNVYKWEGRKQSGVDFARRDDGEMVWENGREDGSWYGVLEVNEKD